MTRRRGVARRIRSTAAWQHARLAILERDGYECQVCHDAPAFEVDHVEPLAVAPQRAFDPSNLRAICRACHALRDARTTPQRAAWDRLLDDRYGQP